MTTVSIYAIERVDLGEVYVGGTVDFDKRQYAHRRGNTAGLMTGPRPTWKILVQDEVRNSSYLQLVHMRRYLVDGWRVVSGIGYDDVKDARVNTSPEFIGRRQGRDPFSGRTPCRWSRREWQARVRDTASTNPGFKRDLVEFYGAVAPRPRAPLAASTRCPRCKREALRERGQAWVCSCGLKLRVP